MAEIISDKYITQAISAAISHEIELAIKHAIENAKNELNDKIPQIIASISLKVMSEVAYERMGNELIIHVKTDGNF